MTALEWDKVGDRRFETGVDRGVLFLLDGTAVPWNGLTSVSETRTREVKSYYLDGVKYLDYHVPGTYAGKLQAFTYPEELEPLLGDAEFAPGVVAHDQRASLFHLAYRNRVGNDLQGSELGYRIHILYNLTASQSDVSFGSADNNVAAQEFEWNLSGTPSQMFGIRPTSHVSIDSTRIDPDLLAEIEVLLYGTAEADPALPDLVTLLGMVSP